METPLSSPCQLGLGGWLSHPRLSYYTPCKVDLDWSYNHFNYFYITDKLCFLSLISFWYLHYLFIPINPLACNWGLSLPFSLLVCYSKNLFFPFQWVEEVIFYYVGRELEKSPMLAKQGKNNNHEHFQVQSSLATSLHNCIQDDLMSLSAVWYVEVSQVLRTTLFPTGKLFS